MMSVLLDKMKKFETSLANLTKEAENPNFIGDLLVKKAYFSYLALGFEHDDVCDMVMNTLAECYQLKAEFQITSNDTRN